MTNLERSHVCCLIACLISLLVLQLNGCARDDQAIINDLFTKGIASCENKNFDEGIQYFNEILKISPNNYYAYLKRGGAYREKKEYDPSLSDFNKCIQLDPTNPYGYYELGELLAAQGKFEEAIQNYTLAIDADSEFGVAYSTRAVMQTMLGKVDLAIEDITKAISLKPEEPMFYFIRGQALDMKGDCKAAIDDLEKAMSLDAENFNMKTNIAWILATCPDGKYRDGKKAMEIALKEILSEENFVTLRTLAAAYAETKDFTNAVKYQKKALEMLNTVIPSSTYEGVFQEKNQKEYMDQLKSYQNKKPWHSR